MIAATVGLLFWAVQGAVAPASAQDCPTGDFAKFYQGPEEFDAAIAGAEAIAPANERLTGIVVPHHLLADHLMALGFRAASGFSYKRIVILTPDHFRQTELFATTKRGFETVLGPVGTDTAAARRLLDSPDFEESCLFQREHGVLALLPFIAHYFPDAEIVPVAMSIRTKRADWDRLADTLAPLVDGDTLIVESTDFSHYLPQGEARRHDQQTMNVLASGALDAIALLHQPRHADSVGALYVQTKLQQSLFGAQPLVIANENSQQYSASFTQETTSYQVILFGAFGPGFAAPRPANTRTYYFAGDTNFGRAMKMALLDADAGDRIAEEILSRTSGGPLIVNLEGVVLPNVPEAIDDMTLAMPEDLTISWLKRLKVAGVGLANNHAMDLGDSGYAETTRALDAAGLPWFGQGEPLELPGLDIVGLSDIDSNGSRQFDLLTPELLDTLLRAGSASPVIAFVHWGREYVTTPSERETMLADDMRRRSVSAIVGAHPHVASAGLDAPGGGDVLQVYSLGNFLFDQNADRASGAMLELTVFEQGTVFGRLMPLPNFFDMAKR
ncbi:MAG: AmmeMemoRadiSam system protein B [Rhizobiaceae bacterium]|nr:AmmeMemoRadiSam system protein B [Rhizobiaceae bacterium]